LLGFISAFFLWQLSLKHVTFKDLDEVGIQNLKTIVSGKNFKTIVSGKNFWHLWPVRRLFTSYQLLRLQFVLLIPKTIYLSHAQAFLRIGHFLKMVMQAVWCL